MDRDNDDSDYHDESEFYYPEELGNHAENINIDEGENATDTIQDYILAQRPESTVKKTKYDIT